MSLHRYDIEPLTEFPNAWGFFKQIHLQTVCKMLEKQPSDEEVTKFLHRRWKELGQPAQKKYEKLAKDCGQVMVEQWEEWEEMSRVGREVESDVHDEDSEEEEQHWLRNDTNSSDDSAPDEPLEKRVRVDEKAGAEAGHSCQID